MAAITETFYLHANGAPQTPTTGQAANLSFRISPYSSDIAGLTFTETPASSGHYVCTGFTTTYYPDAKLYLSAAEVGGWGIHDIGDPSYAFVELTGNQTVAGVKTFSSPPISSSAATATTQLIRWDEACRLADSQVVTGTKVFQALPQTQSSRTYSSDRQFTDKEYVDGVVGSATGMIQSTYVTRVIPTRSAGDRFSWQTVELAKVYLAALTSVTSFRGLVILENFATASNQINVDDGTTIWCSNGIDFWSPNKARINRRGANASLTTDSKFYNVYFNDNTVVAARAWTNPTFQDCDFYVIDTDLTFTSCTFLGSNRIYINGGELTLANCKGSGSLATNAAITWSGSTQPIGVTEGVDANNLGL